MIQYFIIDKRPNGSKFEKLNGSNQYVSSAAASPLFFYPPTSTEAIIGHKRPLMQNTFLSFISLLTYKKYLKKKKKK